MITKVVSTSDQTVLNLERYKLRIKEVFDRAQHDIEYVERSLIRNNGNLIEPGDQYKLACNKIAQILGYPGKCACFTSVGILAALLEDANYPYRIFIGNRISRGEQKVNSLVSHCWITTPIHSGIYQTNESSKISESNAIYEVIRSYRSIEQI